MNDPAASAPARLALSALEPIAAHFSLGLTPRAIGQSLGWQPATRVTLEDIRWAAQALGLKARPVDVRCRATGRRFGRRKAGGPATVPVPGLLLGPDEKIATLVARRSTPAPHPPGGQGTGPADAQSPPSPGAAEEFLLWEPGKARFRWVGLDALTDEYGQQGSLTALVFHQPLRLATPPGEAPPRFGLAWFVPLLWRYRKPLGQVLLGAFLLQLVALTTPLFSQVIIDKVLMHKSLSTLHVLGIGMAGLIVFEAVTSVLRGYMLAHTSARLDAGLSSELFRHLLSLPLRYFEQRQAGDTLARTRELENIRGFFTGSALTTLLDGLFIGIFIAVMLLYSIKLTLVALIGLPLLAMISLVAQPLFERALKARFDRSAEAGNFLVESIQGVHTVKSLALGAIWQRKWDLLAARQVTAGFDVQKFGNAAQSVSQAVQRAMTLAVLWVGTTLVMENQLSVGGLIAFQMLAGQVLQPVARLVGLWQNFQQVKLSVDRLGDLMNARPESVGIETQAMPMLRGRIELQSLHFRYQPEAPLILRDLSLVIEPGEVVGIVGRSGCGKSTLTRLIQRLYGVESGRVLIDGQDIAHGDAQSLRRQFGVVQQDSFLFSGTVAENIAIAQPGTPLERIVHAARQAGAHDFIAGLPQGYDTPVGERGALLSGGQRQRIAIARALIGDPRILLLDEATSALDVESEMAIHANMAQICRGRTVIMVAHRLSTLRDCHRIVVLDGGGIVEQGAMSDLLEQDGPFARMWTMQQQDVAQRAPHLRPLPARAMPQQEAAA